MSAFDTQVGGAHYKSLAVQPVEFWLISDLGAVEGAIVKYMTRWRDKGGLEDLKKVQHFLEIMIEFYEQNDPPPLDPHPPKMSPEEYCHRNSLGAHETVIICRVVEWRHYPNSEHSRIFGLKDALDIVNHMIGDLE